MPKLHVLLKREEIDPARIGDKVVVVLDVLFATTTIVDAFAQGVAGVHPVRTREEGLARADGLLRSVLAGELMARPIEGFGPATPLALSASGLAGSELVYCTTNGTQALLAVADAAHVYVGALLNGKALARHIAVHHPNSSVLIVCSGSVDHFNLEDFHGAGHIIGHLVQKGDYTLTDAAIAACHAFAGCDSRTALFASRVGRMMTQYALDHEVEHACRHDVVDVVPMLADGRLTDMQHARVAA